jgi:hypothetical protein
MQQSTSYRQSRRVLNWMYLGYFCENFGDNFLVDFHDGAKSEGTAGGQCCRVYIAATVYVPDFHRSRKTPRLNPMFLMTESVQIWNNYRGVSKFSDPSAPKHCLPSSHLNQPDKTLDLLSPRIQRNPPSAEYQCLYSGLSNIQVAVLSTNTSLYPSWS